MPSEDFNAHKNSVWRKIMTEGTAAQRAKLRAAMLKDELDRTALERWAASGFASLDVADFSALQIEEEISDLEAE